MAGLSRDQILEYAQRYVDIENAEFPLEGDLFCFFNRDVTQETGADAKKGWKFGGYGICLGYTLDSESKPEGKWVWFSYVGLSTFPPVKLALKLQPPHIVQGRFQNADRSMDIRIIKIPLSDISTAGKPAAVPVEKPAGSDDDTQERRGKILRFPKR